MLTRRQRWWIVGIALAIGVPAFLFSGGQKEPVHEGKPLHEWFDSLSAPGIFSKDDPNVQAIVAMGRDAVPFLMKELCSSESYLAAGLRKRWSQLGFARRPYTPAHIRQGKAWHCLMHLGPKAEPALPGLIKIAQYERGSVRVFAIGLLGNAKSNPTTVIPVLQKLLADPHELYCETAIRSLAMHGTNARPALPRLKEIEADFTAPVRTRINAAQTIILILIDPDNRQSLDFIVARWENTNANREIIVHTLQFLGTNAMMALPSMRRMAQTESDPLLRSSLSNSIDLLEAASRTETSGQSDKTGRQ